MPALSACMVCTRAFTQPLPYVKYSSIFVYFCAMDGISINLISALNGHQDRVWSVAWNPKGTVLASCGGDKTIRLWSEEGNNVVCHPVSVNTTSAPSATCLCWLWVKSGTENAGEKCGTTGNKREYKMRDLIATTARRLEPNTDDVLFHKGSPRVILSK